MPSGGWLKRGTHYRLKRGNDIPLPLFFIFFLIFIFLLFSVFLLAPRVMEATEYQPWLGNLYEFELRSSFRYQGYSKLASGPRSVNYSSDDLFLNLSLSNAKSEPASGLGLELELTQAKTRKQKGEIDQIKLTSRCVLLDDVAGDPIGITVGLSYAQAFPASLKDPSSFHHGLYNSECFLSIGKEQPDDLQWGSRWWGVAGFGVAEKGSAWLRFRLDYEKRLWERHALRGFVHSLCGLGGKRLHADCFQGYGPVAHRSIDVGLRYMYFIEYYGSANIEYSYRVHACNFPSRAHQVLMQVLYTFGL